MSQVIIHCDGLCEPNPNGVACYGWIARDEATGKVLSDARGVIGWNKITNNIAEYVALLSSLKWVFAKTTHLREHHRSVVIRMDSQLVVNQVNCRWECNAFALTHLKYDCLELISDIRGEHISLSLEWIPREQNSEADELSRRAYREATGHEVPERPDWQKKKRVTV